jgi:hypothetical protein
MKQTAVEWLEEALIGHLDISRRYWNELLEQAKKMEKQQMKDTSCPHVGGWEDNEFEQYYNETYKSE